MGDCQVCYNCEKGVAPFVTAEMFLRAQKEGNVPKEWYAGQSAAMPHMTYFLFLTNDCNLRCSYCYAVKTPVVMSEPQTPHTYQQYRDNNEGRSGHNTTRPCTSIHRLQARSHEKQIKA